MLPNTQKLTSQMAMMPDAALKQMAMMHKNDPYTFPLIIAEDSRRKEIRRAAQTKMAGATPPKVNEAAAAEVGSMPNVDVMGNMTGYAQGGTVLPENQGIGALNAPNLQHMADGGIAGYADGGPSQPGMFNYAQMAPAVDLHPNSGVTPRSMAGGGIAHFADTGVVTSAPLSLADVAAELKQADAQLALAVKSGDPQAVQTYTQARDAVRNKLEQTAAKLNVAKVAAPVAPAAPAAAVAPAAAPTPTNDKALALPEDKTPYSLSVPSAPSGLSGSQVQSLIAPPTTKEINDVRNAFKVNPNQTIDPFAAERKEIVESQQRTVENELKDFETSQEKRGDVYANRKERLAGQEEKLKGKEQENQGLSLLEAGLAIFGGTSPFAGANIGEGKVGIKSYREGQDKIERARDRLTDAKDRIEDLETNYKDMSDREKRGLKSNINKATTEGQRLMLDGVSQAYGYDRAEASNLVKAQLENIDKSKTRGLQALISNNEQAGANYRTRLGLTAMPDQIKTAMFLGKGDVDVGYERMAEAARDKSGVALATALETVNARREQAMLPPLTISTFLSHLQQINLGTKPPKSQDEPTGKARP